LIQAFFASEGDEAVPIDQVELRGSEEIPVLLLPPGKIRIKMRDSGGQVKKEVIISISFDSAARSTI
jgi:hypothetical protein